MSTATTTFASLLIRSEDDPQARTELRRQKRLALIPLAVTAALLAVSVSIAFGAVLVSNRLTRHAH